MDKCEASGNSIQIPLIEHENVKKILILQSSEKLFCFCFPLIFIFIYKEVENGNISYASPRAQKASRDFQECSTSSTQRNVDNLMKFFFVPTLISSQKRKISSLDSVSKSPAFSGLIWKSRDLFNDCQLIELWTDKRLSRYLLTTHILCFDDDNAERSQFFPRIILLSSVPWKWQWRQQQPSKRGSEWIQTEIKMSEVCSP